MRQARAAELLGIGVRQVKRLVSAYRRRGDRGLVSGCRGKPANNRLPASTVAALDQALRKLPRPTPVEDDKTIDASLDAVIARNDGPAAPPAAVDGPSY